MQAISTTLVEEVAGSGGFDDWFGVAADVLMVTL